MLAFRLARAAGALVRESERDGHRRPFALVASDTRVSSGMLDAAVTAGLTSSGVDAVRLGVLPTPGLSWLTHHVGAACGVMISASHNPVEDNGVKLFGPDGYKLPDEIELRLESMVEEIERDDRLPRPVGTAVGRVRAEPGWKEDYLRHLAETARGRHDGLRVVLDCANGAAHELAPALFRSLGADVVALNTGDSGEDINVRCGSTHPEELQEEVRRRGADVGLAFDGDADRCIAVDERGDLVDGDRILTIFALDRLASGSLPGGAVACTVYSNGGLAEALRQRGGDVVVTPPGDRQVLAAMLERGLALGGEQSGHIICLERARTGDGMLTGVMLLDVMRRAGRPLSELAARMPSLPQVLLSVRVERKDALLEHPDVREVVARARADLGDHGRVYVRPSGTEPVIRVMVEGHDGAEVQRWAGAIQEVLCRAGRREVGAPDPQR